MGTHIALISSALLVSTFPFAVVKVFSLVWLGAVLSLLAMLALGIIARWVILPYADPDLHRLIAQGQTNSTTGKNYRWRE